MAGRRAARAPAVRRGAARAAHGRGGVPGARRSAPRVTSAAGCGASARSAPWRCRCATPRRGARRHGRARPGTVGRRGRRPARGARGRPARRASRRASALPGTPLDLTTRFHVLGARDEPETCWRAAQPASAGTRSDSSVGLTVRPGSGPAERLVDRAPDAHDGHPVPRARARRGGCASEPLAGSYASTGAIVPPGPSPPTATTRPAARRRAVAAPAGGRVGQRASSSGPLVS